jgi:hypothetical protein
VSGRLPRRLRLPATVWARGGVSFCTDVSSAFAGPVLVGVPWDDGGAWQAFATAALVSVVALVLLIALVPAAAAHRPG